MPKAKKTTKKVTKTTTKKKKTTTGLLTRLKAVLKNNKTGKKKTSTSLTSAQVLYLDSVEKQLADVSENQTGSGGLVVKENGKLVMKTFTRKSEALELIKKIRSGQLQLG